MSVENLSDVRARRRRRALLWSFVVLALLVLGAGAAFLLLGGDAPEPRVSLPVAIAPPADLDAARRAEDIAVCDTALGAAQKLGVVPNFAVRDGDRSASTGVQGRYVCNARTDAARYAVIFDIACTHLGDPRCLVLAAVTQNGTILYKRP